MPAFHATESCNRCQDLSRHKNAYNFGSLYGYNIENQSRLNLIFPKKRLAGMRQKATHLNHFAHCLSYFFSRECQICALKYEYGILIEIVDVTELLP